MPGGLRIQAMATGLMHPRIVYPLPNGDVLVVESNSPGTKPFRPKDYVQGKVKARAGAARRAAIGSLCFAMRDGDGIPELKTVLVDHLHSPYGIALVAGTSTSPTPTRSSLSHSRRGRRKSRRPVLSSPTCRRGPIDHHWTKAMVASPDGSKLYVGVGSNSNITENGMDAEEGARRSTRSTGSPARSASMRRAHAIRPISQSSREPASSSRSSTSATRSDRTSSRLSVFDQGRRLLWLALELLGTACRCPRPPAKPDVGREGDQARLRPQLARGGARARIQPRTSRCRRRFADGAFVGEHGSWDRNPLNGYQVIFVPFVNGHPTGVPIPVVTGFLGSRSQDGSWPAGRGSHSIGPAR